MEISAIKDSLPGLGRCSCLLCPLLPPLLQPLWLKYLNSYMGSKRNFLWMDGAAVNDANANYLLIFLALQGTGHCTKMDNFFRELPKRGGVIFDPTIYIADFVTLNRAFWEWNWYKRIMSGLSRLDIFRKFIRFDAVSQWPVSNQQELPLLSLQYV